MGPSLMKSGIILLLFIWIFISNDCLAFPITIISSNKANACIIVDNNASPQVKSSALLLQSYVKQSTGVLLLIRNEPKIGLASIHIGNTDYLKAKKIAFNLTDEAFLLKTLDTKNFLILGGNDWGTEYGVYSFLETFLGVIWLMPTSEWIEIPKHNAIIIPDYNKIDKPTFLSRDLSPIKVELDGTLNKWGRFNRLKNNIEFHHNLDKLFDVREFGKTNPDFYPTLNGKRMIPKEGDYKWQPNFSAPGIVEASAKKIILYFSKNPNSKSYSLGMNDSQNFDQTTSSLNLRNAKVNSIGFQNYSNEYFQWANKVAQKVNSVYPDKKFGLLAYNNLADPPNSSVGVNPNVVPFLTNELMRWKNDSFQNKAIKRTKAWLSQAKTTGWYDYNYGLCYFLPRIWFHDMKDYLLWGSQNNIKFYYAELYPNWGEGPKAWLTTKLLWNPNQNVDQLLDQWYSATGGAKAGTKLKRYYSIWEQFWTVDIQNSPWYDIDVQYLRFNDLTYLKNIPKNYISESDQLLKDAYNLADSPIRKIRIKKIIEMWYIYKLAIDATITYNAKYPPGIRSSSDLMNALYKLKDDSLHKESISYFLKYVQPGK